jgi:uncharacterized protein (TIGR02118 family)
LDAGGHPPAVVVPRTRRAHVDGSVLCGGGSEGAGVVEEEGAAMIRMSVFYPNGDDVKFDHGYYVDKHMALVRDKMGSALKKVEVDKGIGGMTPDAPPPFIAVGHLFFESAEELMGAVGSAAGELMADIPNFTNAQPEIQISDVTEA